MNASVYEEYLLNNDKEFSKSEMVILSEKVGNAEPLPLIRLNIDRNRKAFESAKVLKRGKLINEEEMKILLANPYALVYDGEIYTFNELSNTPATRSAPSIPADVMEEYLDYIESACNEAGILKYEQEKIDSLRELNGI